MILRRRNLRRHVDRWRRAAEDGHRTVRLASGHLVVLAPDLADRVLRDREHFAEKSAFFRTASFDPIDRDRRHAMITGMMRAFARHPMRPESAFARVEAASGGRHSTQAWGPAFMWALFGDGIADGRPAPIRAVVERVVTDRVIRVDIQGRRPALSTNTWRRDLAAIGGWIGGLDPEHADDPHDLFDVVAGARLDLPPTEAGHLLVRLVQANIAFTGIALEWNLSRAVHDPEYARAVSGGGDLKAHVMRSLMDAPVTWRLTRTVAHAHEIDGVQVEPGDHIVLAVATGQLVRAAAGGEAADLRLLAFGGGPGRCPGESLAYRAIATSIRHVANHYDVVIPDLAARRPYVWSLFAPGRAGIRFAPTTTGRW